MGYIIVIYLLAILRYLIYLFKRCNTYLYRFVIDVYLSLLCVEPPNTAPFRSIKDLLSTFRTHPILVANFVSSSEVLAGEDNVFVRESFWG